MVTDLGTRIDTAQEHVSNVNTRLKVSVPLPMLCSMLQNYFVPRVWCKLSYFSFWGFIHKSIFYSCVS